MAHASLAIECGFCLRKNDALLEPKSLPCKHVHCLECLSTYFDINQRLVCPIQGCGEVFEVSPDTLPSYKTGSERKLCDVCVKKKTSKEEAVTYCTDCSKAFCNKHMEQHDKVLDEHNKISMDEYMAQVTKLQIRTCTKHEDQSYTMGCKVCQTLTCLKCLSEVDNCSTGGLHCFLSLDDLVKALMDDIGAAMVAKEDLYERIFKEASKARANYEQKTAEMIKLIHQTRDNQPDAIKLKYQKLEEKVLKKREKSKLDITDFMEDVVIRKWTEIRNHRQWFEQKAKCSHQVDFIKGFETLKEEIDKLIQEELPKLGLTSWN